MTTLQSVVSVAQSNLACAELTRRNFRLQDGNRIATLTFNPGTPVEEATGFVKRLIADLDPGTPQVEGRDGEQKNVTILTTAGINCTQVHVSNRYWTPAQVEKFDLILATVCRLLNAKFSSR